MSWTERKAAMRRAMIRVVLDTAYRLVITPLSLWLKRRGWTAFPVRPDPDCATYWLDRDVPIQPLERYERRY